MSAPVNPPARRQRALLRFLAGYAEAHRGVMPTLREMAPAIGMRGRSGPLRVLRRLQARGLVRRLSNRERAIELLFVPAVPRAPDGAPLMFIPVEWLGFHELQHNQRNGQDHV